MRRERTAIAQTVARQLWEAERANDIAMASTARLIATALEARIALKAAASVGHGALEAMVATLDRQSASRGLLLGAHGDLNGVREAWRLDASDFGGGGDKEVPMGSVVELPVCVAA